MLQRHAGESDERPAGRVLACAARAETRGPPVRAAFKALRQGMHSCVWSSSSSARASESSPRRYEGMSDW